MASTADQLPLYAAAVWAWAWLVAVTRRELPKTIYVQQNIGLYTPWLVYSLAGASRRLAVGGAAAVGAACLVPEIRTPVAVGLLVAAGGLLTYAYTQAARLLDPRIVNALLARGDDGPDE